MFCERFSFSFFFQIELTQGYLVITAAQSPAFLMYTLSGGRERAVAGKAEELHALAFLRGGLF